MLTVTIPAYEAFNEQTQEFINIKKTTIQLEHSLISLKKWEQRWHKPFLADKSKTLEETVDYIKCMTITPNVDPEIYSYIPTDVVKEITNYIEDPMTATWFNDNATVGAQKSNSEVITAEIIYYWMIELGVPVEFQKWHLNQLLTLIRVINIKRTPSKKMGKREWASQRSALNAARRAKNHSKG